MDTGGPEPKLEQTADVSAGQNDETPQSDDAVEEVESTGGKEEADSLLGVEGSEPKSEEAVVLSAGQQEETPLSGEEEEADATAEKESDAAQEPRGDHRWI